MKYCIKITKLYIKSNSLKGSRSNTSRELYIVIIIVVFYHITYPELHTGNIMHLNMFRTRSLRVVCYE